MTSKQNLIPQGWSRKSRAFGTFWVLNSSAFLNHSQTCWVSIATKLRSQPRSSWQPIYVLSPSRPLMLRTVTTQIVMETPAAWNRRAMTPKWKWTPDSGQRVACLDSCKDMAVQAMPPPQPEMKTRTRARHLWALIRDLWLIRTYHRKYTGKTWKTGEVILFGVSRQVRHMPTYTKKTSGISKIHL